MQLFSALFFRSVGVIPSKQTYMMGIQSFKMQCLADYIIVLFHMSAYEAVFFVFTLDWVRVDRALVYCSS